MWLITSIHRWFVQATSSFRLIAVAFALALAQPQYAAAQPAEPIELHVGGDDASDNPGGSTPGQDWSTAFLYLQDAMTEAANLLGEDPPPAWVEIWVAAGTYYADDGDGYTSGDTFAVFELRNNVRIYGGFSGRETVLNDRDPVRNVTILSGDLAGDDDPDDPFNTGLTDDNSLNIVICDGDAATALLDGFTVTGATGSGVFLSFCSPSIVRCNITKNRSDAGGGARAKSGSPLFYNCSFFENRAENSAGSGAGGGFHVGAGALASSALLINCLFHDNEALGTFGDGGGLYIQWRIRTYPKPLKVTE